MKVYLIRHEKTYGNTKKRYIGITDEPLCEEGIKRLGEKKFPCVDMVFSSPLQRCIQTAHISYPKQEIHKIGELAECNFGDFENKNYEELGDNPDYQKWIDSNGKLPFPNGESREEFRRRCLEGFEKVCTRCRQEGKETAAIICHGGTIMHIMERYTIQKKTFYEWWIENGDWYKLEMENKNKC